MSEVRGRTAPQGALVRSFDQIDAPSSDNSEEYLLSENNDPPDSDPSSVSETSNGDEPVNYSNCSRLIAIIFMLIANSGFIMNSFFIK